VADGDTSAQRELLDGRGKPASGPLDGDGRRSLYLAVRRNFLSPLLLAFDTPSPFSTIGRRTVSNVPAYPKKLPSVLIATVATKPSASAAAKPKCARFIDNTIT